jgi:hypothetical protein
MPVTLKIAIFNKGEEETRFCWLCHEELSNGERHVYWGIQFEKEFVQCSFHRTPTMVQVGLSVLYSYGFVDTFRMKQGEIQYFKINKTNRREKILNPATPSFITAEQMLELYESPTSELVTKLINENLHPNKYWKDKAEDELKTKEVSAGDDGIRRGARVLSLDRNCSECNVSEAEMVAKNPRYTLCRGVCVVCYRRLYRKKANAITN